MTEFVRYTLDDGTEVYFETTAPSGATMQPRGAGDAGPADGGRLADRLEPIAKAAAEVSRGLRSQMSPDEIELTFGVKLSGGVGWWCFGKADGEASIQVTCTWKPRDGDSGDGDSAGSAGRAGRAQVA